MTDLTEQWKKGELPEGEYWCLSICDDIDKLYCYQNSFWKYKTEDDYYGVPVEIKQVLAPVPSYEEYEQLENWNRFTADYHALREAKEIEEYEKVELLEKVKQLKELLESALSWLPDSSKFRGGRYAQIQNLKRKIKEVL